MKKRITRSLIFGFIFSSAFIFSSCASKNSNISNNENESNNVITTNNIVNQDDEIYSIYLLAKDSGYSGTYEEWLDSIRGDVIELQINSGYVQWKYKNDNKWINLIDLNSLTGAQGAAGKDGKSMEMRVADSFIQWKYLDEAENSWRNLLSISAFTGAAGKDGKSTEMRISDGFIQWKYIEDTDNSWKNMISIESITGPQGTSGREIELSTNTDYVLWRYVGTDDWNNLIQLSLIKGDSGKSAYDIAVECGYTGTKEEWLLSLKGNDGVGIKSTYIDDNGDLIITYTDGTIINAGHISTSTIESTLDFYPYPDGTYGVSAGKARYLEEIVIPDEFNGKKVTRIIDGGFYGCPNLKSITIPSTITNIGDSAFSRCSSLESITIPSTVTSIGNSTFAECSSLESITIPSTVTSIGESAFESCTSLNNVTILEGVTSIGESVFESCDSLESITIPSTVTSIGESAFKNCSSLNNVVMQEGVASIGDSAFYKCALLESIKIPSTVTSIGNFTFAVCSSLKNVIIPEGVTSIGESTFAKCSSLKNVIIPEGVTSIGNLAFYECYSLDSITIPNTVTSIGESTFAKCSSLEILVIPKELTNINYSTFNMCENLRTIYYYGTDNSSIKSCFLDAAIWYYYTINGIDETSSGKWWYYDNDNNIKTVSNLSVRYYEVTKIGESKEIVNATQVVKEGTKISVPEEKLKKDGYKINGYYIDKTCYTKFDFNAAIYNDTKIYVGYDQIGMYDELVTSDYLLLAYDFNNPTTIIEGSEFGSTIPTLKTNDPGNVEIINGALSLSKNQLLMDFGQTLGTGVITMYFEVTFERVKTKEAFIQINGTSSKKSDAEVIGIRVDNTSKFAYRLDEDATDITIGTNTVSTATKYKFLVEIDTAEGLLNISVNGSKLLDKASIVVDSINGLKFTSKPEGTSAKVIDNVAILFEEKQANSFVAARNALLNDIASYVDEVSSLDVLIQEMVSNKALEIRNLISSATNEEDITELQTQWTTFKNTNKYLVTVTPVLADGTAVTELETFKFAVLDGQTPNLDVVEYSLYDTNGIYTDNTFTTEYTLGEVKSNLELYVKVAKCELKSFYKFEASSLTAAADNEAFIAGNYLIGTDSFFKLVSNGTAVKRYSIYTEAVYAIELGKSFQNYIEFTTTGPCTIVMHAGSTSSSNTTSGFGVYTDNQGKTLASGVTAQSITGTDTELTFNISAAGTYYIGYTESGRAGRFISIDVQYQAN